MKVYVDGSCSVDQSKKKWPGGWAALVVDGFEVVSFDAGNSKDTTNNRMELMAAIRGILMAVGLQDRLADSTIELITDSKYISDAFALKWVENWLHKGRHRGMLIRSEGQKVENSDLWWVLIFLVKELNVKIKWQKGKTDDFTRQVDELAKTQTRKAAGGKIPVTALERGKAKKKDALKNKRVSYTTLHEQGRGVARPLIGKKKK